MGYQNLKKNIRFLIDFEFVNFDIVFSYLENFIFENDDCE